MGLLSALVAPAAKTVSAAPAGRVLQRQCACAGRCERCNERRKRLQRKANGPGQRGDVPSVVDDVLRASGTPLDTASRAFMEPRFGQSFGDVRVHSGARAAAAARAVDAHAFTVGRDIVFDSGRYAPGSADGRRLLAHELTHVVQQRHASVSSGLTVDGADSAGEREADRVGAAVAATPWPGAGGATVVAERAGAARVSRRSAASPDATALTRQLGNVPRSGLQFVPNNITDTVVGPPEVRGGLLDGQALRLNVIVAEGQSLRTLATELLPLWLTATPFTPPGAAAPLPLDIISALELARALLVHNQTYLPVPAMTRWRAGLRLPLPVRIDEATRVGTLHPLNIKALASGFDPAWLPLLDLRAASSAAQADGAAVLAVLRTALAAAPAAPTAAQQASLTRANLMLGRVGGTPAAAAPGAMRNPALKTVTVDTVKLVGSNRDPAIDVALANGVLAQCNVQLAHGINQTATAAETTAWIGADAVYDFNNCSPIDGDQRQLITGATVRFGLNARLRAFYVPTISGNPRAASCRAGIGTPVNRETLAVSNSASGRTLAHEIGHILLNSGDHPAGAVNVMSPTNTAPLGETFTDAQCTTLYAHS